MQVGDAYLIVYSITDRASFEKASELRIQLRRARQTEDIPIILVGNKSDLVRCREVSVSGEVLGTTLAPHTLACRQVPFPSPLQGCNQGLSGVLRGVSCLRHPRFPSFVLVSVSRSPDPSLPSGFQALPTALRAFFRSYFREESILRNVLAVLTFAPRTSVLQADFKFRGGNVAY